VKEHLEWWVVIKPFLNLYNLPKLLGYMKIPKLPKYFQASGVFQKFPIFLGKNEIVFNLSKMPGIIG
jgi:hypothetical protein